MTWIRKNWLLILILSLALIFRLYRVGATMTFLEDEGRDLLIVNRMIETGRPVLLGPQTSTGNMYLGPLYYYLITPSLFLAGMNPVGPAIFIALSGVLTAYLLYYLGKKWFGDTAGYVASSMFALLPLGVMVTRGSWNPNLVPVVTVLMLLVYDTIVYGKATIKTWFSYGLLIGVMIQLHYMALVYCGILSISIVWNKRSELLKVIKGALIAFVGVLVMLLPFIVFEIRNDWVNTTALTRFMVAKEERNIRYDLPLWLWWDKVSKTSYRLVGHSLVGDELNVASKYAVSGFLIISLVSLFMAFFKKNKFYLNLVAIFIGSLAVLGIYQENIHMHYIEFGIPLIFLMIAGVYSKHNPKLLKWLVLIFFVLTMYVGVSRTYSNINSGATFQAKKAKDVADYIVAKAGGDEYNVVSTQGMYTTPFQYFLAISDNPPVNTLAKRVFDICAGEPCPIDDETTTLLFLTGPGHPSIVNYLGHPQLNSFEDARKMVSNQHVSVGVWVAELVLE